MTAERAIERIKNIPVVHWEGCGDHSGLNEALSMAIKALERQRWILVSERLPEDSRDVIVTTRSGVIGVGSYLDSGDDWVQWYSGGGMNVDVVAWQPLPEPFKGE